MAAYIRLYRKGTAEADTFADIDTKMRVALGQPPSEDKFYKGWYDSIAFGLAVGRTFAQLREDYEGQMDDVINWLEANYSPDAWYSR